MFSRVLKSQTAQFLTSSSSTSSADQAPPSPSKSRSSHKSSQSSAAPPTPSKIPVPTATRANAASIPNARNGEPTKENRGGADRDWAHYTPSSQQGNAGAPPPSPSRSSNHITTQSQSNGGLTSTSNSNNNTYSSNGSSAHSSQNLRAPPPPSSSAASSHKSAPQEDSDIHMMTVNPKTVNPALLHQLAQLPISNNASSHSTPAPASSIPTPVFRSNPPKTIPEDRDVRMQTVHREAATAGHPKREKSQPGEERDARANAPVQMELWEREILNSAEVKRKATLAQLYFLDYYFDLLGYLHSRKGRLQGFKADTASRHLTQEEYNKEFTSYNGRERVLLRKRRTKLRVEQFRIIAQVGQGGYGSVYLARKTDTGQVCALKKMKKTTLAKMDEVKHVLVERDILTATKTPWLVSLLYAFQDRDHVYLAMEYVPGGDFRTLLNNSGVLKEEHARFYSAEMFAGVNELHKLGYIHRDLKPENFLVAGDGHVKLTDFGLATGALNPLKIESMKNKLDQVKDENLVYRSTLERRTIYKSMRMAEPRYADSVVGSPDYMPPEVLRGRTYTYSADYWSLGCILFEFLCGFPPFSGGTPEETWANLKNWPKVLRRPVYEKPEDLIFNLTDPAWDAVTRLIAHPRDRISSLHEVQTLPFFVNLPFSSLRQIPAPFVPMLESDSDVGYFDAFDSPEDMAKYAEVFKKQADVDAVAEKGAGGRNAWVGFTFGRNANIPAPPQGRKPEGEALQTMF